MAVPYFYTPQLLTGNITLDEDTSKHVVQVLRKSKEDILSLTDGKGNRAEALIVNADRRHCLVSVKSVIKEESTAQKVSIAISLIKNTSRFEWFLEKATEIGVNEIFPLLCERTEKEKFRFDRLHNILVSAMLQSQQCRLPVLHQPTEFKKAIQLPAFDKKFIAHCMEAEKKLLSLQLQESSGSLLSGSTLIFIGPEGDFSSIEIDLALAQNILPVSLGPTRLRTETAALAAAILMINVPRLPHP
jgi:16S rRNA (uracil1498-N3)-methyltransferase